MQSTAYLLNPTMISYTIKWKKCGPRGSVTWAIVRALEILSVWEGLPSECGVSSILVKADWCIAILLPMHWTVYKVSRMWPMSKHAPFRLWDAPLSDCTTVRLHQVVGFEVTGRQSWGTEKSGIPKACGWWEAARKIVTSWESTNHCRERRGISTHWNNKYIIPTVAQGANPPEVVSDSLQQNSSFPSE